MARIGENFSYDNVELKQMTFVALETIFETFGEDLSPYVDQLVETTRQNILSSDYLQFTEKVDDDHAAIAEAVGRLAGDDEEQDDNAPAKHGDDEDGEDDDDDDDSEDYDFNNLELKVHTSQVEMKSAALSCFGYIAKHCPKAFAPHLKDGLQLLEDHVGAFHEKLRQRAILSLPCLVSSMLAVAPPIPPASPEEPAIMTSDCRKMFDEVIHSLTMVLQREADMSTVQSACIAIEQICREVGMAAVVTHHALLMKELIKLGKGKARCQRVNDDGEGGPTFDSDDEEEDDEDDDEDGNGAAAKGSKKNPINASKAAAAIAKAAQQAGMGGGHGHGGHGGGDEGDDDEEHDHELIDAATDAVLRVGNAMRSHFAIYLPEVVKTWMRFTTSDMSYIDQCMAAGLFADYAVGLGTTFSPYVEQVLPFVLKGTGDADPEVRRNCLYCIGTFLQHCTEATRPHLNVFLQALFPSFVAGSRAACGNDKAEHMAIDNAASALCKAILAVPEAVPLAMALPPLVAVLPLHGDWEEAKFVYTCLMRLLASENAEIIKLLPQVLHIAAVALLPESRVSEEVQTTVIGLNLKAVAATGSAATKAALASALATLSEAERAVLMRAVS
jgi:HEAT repeat